MSVPDREEAVEWSGAFRAVCFVSAPGKVRVPEGPLVGSMDDPLTGFNKAVDSAVIIRLVLAHRRSDLVVAIEHLSMAQVHAMLMFTHPSIVFQLPPETAQDRFTHLFGEYAGPTSNLSQAYLMRATLWSRA